MVNGDGYGFSDYGSISYAPFSGRYGPVDC